MLEQGVNQNPAQCAEEKQQIAQLVHGEHGTAPGRTHAIARQQRHDGQRPPAAAGRGAVSELGGHDHSEAFDPADLVALIPQQQSQAHRIQHPAQQDHAEHDQQPLQRKFLQSRPGFVAAQQ
ncbi:hypothetical protein D3C84_1045490 [compost metagenome]